MFFILSLSVCVFDALSISQRLICAGRNRLPWPLFGRVSAWSAFGRTDKCAVVIWDR